MLPPTVGGEESLVVFCGEMLRLQFYSMQHVWKGKLNERNFFEGKGKQFLWNS